jgi:hypothetical protein
MLASQAHLSYMTFCNIIGITVFIKFEVIRQTNFKKKYSSSFSHITEIGYPLTMKIRTDQKNIIYIQQGQYFYLTR